MSKQEIEQILKDSFKQAFLGKMGDVAPGSLLEKFMEQAAAAIAEAMEREKQENFPLFEQTKKKLNTVLMNCVARKELHLMEASHIMSVYANHAKPHPPTNDTLPG